MRAAPATVVYVLVLAATTLVLSLSSERTSDRILASLSTNLHELAHRPVRAILGSPFWVGGWADFAVCAAVLLAVAAPVERRLGWRRTTAVFAAGHVGATLLVAGGLWILLRLDVLDPAVERARDVGASYGMLAVCGVATYLLAPRRRLPYVAALGGFVALAAAVSHTFTDFGHLSAVAIGFACYPVARLAPVAEVGPVSDGAVARGARAAAAGSRATRHESAACRPGAR
jgi:membrane associated rhomboid family serine protease